MMRKQELVIWDLSVNVPIDHYHSGETPNSFSLLSLETF